MPNRTRNVLRSQRNSRFLGDLGALFSVLFNSQIYTLKSIVLVSIAINFNADGLEFSKNCSVTLLTITFGLY